ncbi:MAG: hypothetical protein C4529_15045 [Deltaproteobacteria bacterium]|nr:MAG: hypothetical protein C4529_15045 [Deltaproteobacteria bacterium]
MRGVATAVLSALVRGPGFTTAWLSRETGLTAKQVSDACAVLLRRGFIASRVAGRYRVTDTGRELLSAGEVVKSGHPAGPRDRRIVRNTLREKVWRALGMLRKATIPELLSFAAIGEEKAANNNVRKYLLALEKAGYLVRDARRVPGTAPTSNGYSLFVLIERTGPQAPIYSNRKGHLYDPNTKKEIAL